MSAHGSDYTDVDEGIGEFAPMCDAEDEVCQSCGHEIDIDSHCGCPWPCNVEGCTRPREEGCELCTQHTDEALADCGEK